MFGPGGPGSSLGPNGSKSSNNNKPGDPSNGEDPSNGTAGNGTAGNGAAGSGNDPGGENPLGPRPPAFSCDPDAIAPEQPLRRLSSSQYRNALRDLIAATAPGNSATIMASLEAPLSALPRDIRSGPEPDYGGMRRLDQTIYAETIEGTYQVALAAGAALTSASNRLQAAAGSCATDTNTGNDAACVDNFIRSFGKRALRRPLNDDDVAFYREAVQDTPVSTQDYADIVATILSSPYFLYAVELGEDAAQRETSVPLTGYELATRLALHFWQSTPDDALLEAAESGALLDPDQYEAQVERVYADPRTAQTIEEFFVDWLQPKHLEDLRSHVGSPDYDALRGSFEPSAELKSRMLRELGRIGSYYAHTTESTFADLMKSRHAFPETADLAEIYGVPVWKPGDEPPLFPEDEREGLLTHAAMVATGYATSHPIFKGVYTRKAVLCDQIPPPPADANAVAMTVKPSGITSRALTEALSMARGDCASCHATMINPIGFALENFDGLGRFRSVERVFDPEDGELVGEVEVNSAAVLAHRARGRARSRRACGPPPVHAR